MRSRGRRKARRYFPAGRWTAALSALCCGALPLACAPPKVADRDVEPRAAWLDRSAGTDERRNALAPRASSPSDAAPDPWELAAEMPTFRAATGRGRSQHFTGEMEAEVRINPAAAAYPALGPERVLPPGAAVIELHYARGAPDPAALFAMTKHAPGYDPDGGDWEYLVLTPAGQVTHRGPLPLCKRCHDDAPHDHLFGGPR